MAAPALPIARPRAVSPQRVLVALAACAVVSGTLEAALRHDVGRRDVVVVFAPLLALAVAWAWRAPLGAALAFGALAAAQGALGGRIMESAVTQLLVCMALVVVLALRASDRDFALGAVGMVVLVSLSGILAGEDSPPALVVWVALVPVGIPAAGGRVLRARNDLNRRLEDQAHELARNRAERERAAVLSERTRIARELHDVVAHDVSIMLVQAAAAKRTVPTDPDRARAAIAAVEGTGREALGELRRLLGVLRRGDEELALAPQPTLTRIGPLVERMRAAGLTVDLEVEGEPVALPAGLDAAAFRIIQEALANIARHAGGARAAVRLAYAPTALELTVSDAGAGTGETGDGHGLVGLRERVALYGGRLTAGPRSGGGFELRASLPVAGAAA
jgi:signal transduction histidine kinase